MLFSTLPSILGLRMEGMANCPATACHCPFIPHKASWEGEPLGVHKAPPSCPGCPWNVWSCQVTAALRKDFPSGLYYSLGSALFSLHQALNLLLCYFSQTSRGESSGCRLLTGAAVSPGSTQQSARQSHKPRIHVGPFPAVPARWPHWVLWVPSWNCPAYFKACRQGPTCRISSSSFSQDSSTLWASSC